MAELKSIAVSGWKSIKHAQFSLGPLNVLIGANGSGKSNFISFFKLLNEMIEGRLQEYITKAGGSNAVLYYGAKATPILGAQIQFRTPAGDTEYSLRLADASPDSLVFLEERVNRGAQKGDNGLNFHFGPGHHESELAKWAVYPEIDPIVRVLRTSPYQFHDTSSTAPIRRFGRIEDNQRLYPDGRNLAAMLFRYKRQTPDLFRRIVGTVRQINPRFGDFVLEPRSFNTAEIMLNWRERDRDYLFGPHQISDGTLRVMALVTLLLQPEDQLPDVVVIDEPELGLHPYAIEVLAGLFRKASHHCQVIVSTQSAELLDHFEAEEVVVVDRKGEASEYRRLSATELETWLDEYTLSELWEKNVFGGGPH